MYKCLSCRKYIKGAGGGGKEGERRREKHLKEGKEERGKESLEVYEKTIELICKQ